VDCRQHESVVFGGDGTLDWCKGREMVVTLRGDRVQGSFRRAYWCKFRPVLYWAMWPCRDLQQKKIKGQEFWLIRSS
jgi:hypothetical protein